MARGRRNLELTDYRSVLNTSGDVAFGAYARQQRRRRIVVALGGVALIAAAIWLFVALSPGSDATSAVRYAVVVECVECGRRELIEVDLTTDSLPAVCADCGVRSCYKLWQCRRCGTAFLPKGQSDVVRCPNCGSTSVGTAEIPRHEDAVGGIESQGAAGNGR